MITKRTLLILGAGASNHIGYPIGRDLINQICLSNNIEKFKENNNNNFSENTRNLLKGKCRARPWPDPVGYFIFSLYHVIAF